MAEKVVFKYGTRAEYDAVATKNPNQLYFLIDTGEIYRGTVNLARGHNYETVRQGTETDNEAITRGLADAQHIAIQDDIFVIKTPISGTADKYSYTSYVYDGSNWCAMDGNYSAENVYFNKDMVFTYDIGSVKTVNGQQTIETSGKNIKEVFELLFSKETEPTATKPTISVTLAQAGEHEVGEAITPTYTTSFNAGKYTYGPATGITQSSISVTDGAVTRTESSGSMDEITVTDGMNYRLTATVEHTEGAVPVSNLGNEKEAQKIAAGTITGTSGAITAYRKMFIGGVTNTDAEIDSALIRGLNVGRKAASATMQYQAATVTDTKRVIVAIPTASGKTIKKVTMPSALGADATTSFVKVDNVSVEGANGATAVSYAVWVYQPDNLDASEIYDIVID